MKGYNQERSDFHLENSCNTPDTSRMEPPHTEGVALMPAQEALIGWEPVNSRIIKAKFTTKKKDVRLNIIQC